MKREISDDEYLRLIKQKQSVVAERKSDLVKAIETRKRPLHEFDLDGILGLGGQPITKIKIRRPVKSELTKAVAGAAKAVDEIAGQSKSAKDDPDLYSDVKSCWALHAACRDFNDPESWPAFPSPQWMMDNMTSEELAVLLNYYTEVVRRDGIIKEDVTPDDLEKIIFGVSTLNDMSATSMLLSRITRESLINIICELCFIVSDLRNASNQADVVGPSHDGQETSENGQPDQDVSGGS